MATFLVPAGVSSGWSAESAGLLLAIASLTGVGVRIGMGWIVDRRPGNELTLAAVMLLIGSIGFLGLTVNAHPVGQVISVLLAFGAGWGWPGIFFLAIVEGNRKAPAAATGVAITGGSLGSGLGPFFFGMMATHYSYTGAWMVNSCLVMMAAALMLAGRRMLSRESQLQHG